MLILWHPLDRRAPRPGDYVYANGGLCRVTRQRRLWKPRTGLIVTLRRAPRWEAAWVRVCLWLARVG